MKQAVKVWNVNTTDKGMVRVATIEQGPRKPGMCDGCPSPCCQGMFRPILDSEEFLSKKFLTMFIEIPEWLKKKAPRADKIAVLAFTNGTKCNYFDAISHRCTIFPNCPKGCLSYDCREDTRPEIKSFVKMRKKQWRHNP